MLCVYNFDELNAYILSLNNNNNNSIIKAQKNSIILKDFGTKGFRLQDLKQNSHSCTRFACRKHLNGFRRQKKKINTMKTFAEFYYRQIAEKMLSKIPAMHH